MGLDRTDSWDDYLTAMNTNTTTTNKTNAKLNAEFIREYLKLSPSSQACVFACMQAMAALQDHKRDDADAWLKVAKAIKPAQSKRLENFVNGH